MPSTDPDRASTPTASLRRGTWALVLSSLWALGSSGCGEAGLPSVTAYEVKGKVMLANGKPLTSGYIHFVPKTEGAHAASGTIDENGEFSLKTLNGTVGAAPGEYAVRVEVGDDVVPKKGKDAMPFPMKYTDEASSGIVAKVEAKSNQLEPFVLK